MDEKVHFSRPPRTSELAKALEKTSVVYMPRSCFTRLSTKARKLLDEKGTGVMIEEARGRPIALPMEKILEVAELHKDHRTYRQIEQITGIPKSTAHYLVKYAERQKLKKGGKVVYV